MLRYLCLLALFCAAWLAYAAMDIVIIGPASTASTAPPEGDPVAGKKKSRECQSCHGEDGVSVNPMCPNLAGQFPKYLEKQIRDFQSGQRVDPVMTRMAATLTEKQDAKDIAAYFSSRKRMAGTNGGNKDMMAKGEILFKAGNAGTGLYGCVNCHGENGKGKAENNNVFPVIGGQSKDYIVKQLKALHRGGRHNDPAGMMGDIAKKLTDEEINAVAEYVAGL